MPTRADASPNRFLARFADAPALVAPERRDEFEALLVALHADTSLIDAENQREAAAAGDDPFWTELGRATQVYRPYVVRNGILLVPVRGVLLHDFPYQFGAYATGYQYLSKALARGLDDEEVRGIAYVVNSPGGEVAGCFDHVDQMFAARGRKPIRAFAAEAAYSAAYAIVSATDKITVARTGGVGSIGVVTTHVDVSKAYEDIGFKVTFVFAGAHKVDGNAFEPLPDAVKARIQERVDALYDVFVSTVARNRSMDEQAVRNTEALTFMSDEATANGLADAIGSLDAALAEFSADVLNPDEGDETMSDTKPAMTVASAKADYPDVANALINEGKELGKAEAKTSFETQMTAERSRVAALDKLAGQMGGSASALTIIAAAKADGSSAADTSLKLIEAGAHKASAAGEALLSDEEKARAANPAAPGGAAKAPATPEGWKAEWSSNEKLQAEFPSAETYVAHKRDEFRKGARN